MNSKLIQNYLDVDNTLKRLENNQDLYSKLLHDFSSLYKNGVLSDIAEMDMNDKLLYFHTLKGLLMNIGAIELGQMSKQIETTLKNGDDIEGLRNIDHMITKLNDELKLLTTALNQNFVEDKGKEKIPLDIKLSENEIKDKLKSLHEQLDNYSIGADQILLDLRHYILENFGAPFYESIYDAVKSYDYDEAMSLLNEIKDD